jgi:hypothetical protein
MSVSEIEDAIARNELTAAAVFAMMRGKLTAAEMELDEVQDWCAHCACPHCKRLQEKYT